MSVDLFGNEILPKSKTKSKKQPASKKIKVEKSANGYLTDYNIEDIGINADYLKHGEITRFYNRTDL